MLLAPDMQGRGIGAALLRSVEQHGGKDVRRFGLHTGDRSQANINLYRKVGYTETRREVVAESLSLVHMAKPAMRLPTCEGKLKIEQRYCRVPHRSS